MADRVEREINIENARIFYRNFAGKEQRYNPSGSRNFCVEIPHDLAQDLIDEGWNVRVMPPRNPDQEPIHYMQVSVSFRNIPPNIYLMTGRRRQRLTEETVEALDYAEIQTVDLTIKPYNWDVGRVKAYLKTMYVQIVEDHFAEKWAHLEGPDDM